MSYDRVNFVSDQAAIKAREAADLAAIKAREVAVLQAIERGDPEIECGSFGMSQLGLLPVVADKLGRLWICEGTKLVLASARKRGKSYDPDNCVADAVYAGKARAEMTRDEVVRDWKAAVLPANFRASCPAVRPDGPSVLVYPYRTGQIGGPFLWVLMDGDIMHDDIDAVIQDGGREDTYRCAVDAAIERLMQRVDK